MNYAEATSQRRPCPGHRRSPGQRHCLGRRMGQAHHQRSSISCGSPWGRRQSVRQGERL